MTAKVVKTVFSVLATALLLGVSGLIATSGAEWNGETAVNSGSETSALTLADLRPLDDPAGPYYGRYDAPDRWIVANAAGISREHTNECYQSMSSDELYMYTVVDEQGWVVPGRIFLEQRAETKNSGERLPRHEDKYWLCAVGPMDESVMQAGREIGWEVEAGYYQPVPEWLAAAPPQRAIVLPNGDVIARGKLGSGIDEQGNDITRHVQGELSHEYRRYDAAGNLLGYTADSRWILLFRDFRVEGWPEGICGIRGDGYFIFFDYGDIEGHDTDYALDLYKDFPVKSVYDYDGTLLDFTRNPPQRGYYGFNQLSPYALRELYRAQVRTGR